MPGRIVRLGSEAWGLQPAPGPSAAALLLLNQQEWGDGSPWTMVTILHKQTWGCSHEESHLCIASAKAFLRCTARHWHASATCRGKPPPDSHLFQKTSELGHLFYAHGRSGEDKLWTNYAMPSHGSFFFLVLRHTLNETPVVLKNLLFKTGEEVHWCSRLKGFFHLS